jgi:arylsulfatase A-like enzyme
VPERLTRKDFLKGVAAGTAGVATLGASAAFGSRYTEYLPKGSSKVNVILVIVDSLRRDHVGAYGNGWIKTPNLDALTKESLLFTRPYPESIPTIPARRAIHTGVRTWPFRDWHPSPDDGFKPYGWAPVPEDQVVLAELLSAEGINTNIVTDTLHLYRAFYDFQRGFDTFDCIRGQERDQYRPMMGVSDARVDAVTVPGNDPDMRDKARQYLANTSYRKTEGDWFAPRAFASAGEYLGHIMEAQPFFLLVDCFDPHEPWDPPRKYVDLYGDPDYSGREPTVPNYSDASWITEGELERMRALYAGEVTMADAWLGRLLERIEDFGLAENTLLILLSDQWRLPGRARRHWQALLGALPRAHRHRLHDAPPFWQGRRHEERLLRLHPRRGPHDPVHARHREASADGRYGPFSSLRRQRAGPEARALHPWLQRLRLDA